MLSFTAKRAAVVSAAVLYCALVRR